MPIIRLFLNAMIEYPMLNELFAEHSTNSVWKLKALIVSEKNGSGCFPVLCQGKPVEEPR
jgi:hypothetical protein